MKTIKKEDMVKDIVAGRKNACEESKAIIDFIATTFKDNPRNLTLKEIQDNQARIFTLNKQAKLPIEANKKKLKKSDKKNPKDKVEEVAEKIVNIIDAKKPIETSTKVLKKVDKKEDKKDTKKLHKNKDNKITLKVKEVPQIFPPHFENKEIGKFQLRSDIKSIKDLYKEIEDGKELYICTYWNKTDLKKYTYDPLSINKEDIPEFELDLDIMSIMFCSEEGKVVYGVSLYTEVNSAFLPHGFKTDEKTGCRYTNGMEYQVYELVSEKK
jgi:predicted peroxiredoxin